MIHEERLKLFYYQYFNCFRNTSKRDRLMEIAKLNNATEEELKDVDCAIAQMCYYYIIKDYEMCDNCFRKISKDQMNNDDLLCIVCFRTFDMIRFLKDQTSHLASNMAIAKYYQNKDDRIEKYNKYIEKVANIAQVTNTGNIDTIIELIDKKIEKNNVL